MVRSKMYSVVFIAMCAMSSWTMAAASRPNIVLVFMDNFGWGELGVYGGGVLRGAPTPQIDSIARNGMRLLNFNVEHSAHRAEQLS